MRELSLNDLELEIVRQVRKWKDEYDVDIDAGDAVSLAAEIAVRVIGSGVGIVGPWESHRALSEGWE